MEQSRVAAEYAADLSRAEYVRSQELVSKALRGRQIAGSRWFTGAMMLVCVASLGTDYRLSGTWDISLVLLVSLMILAELWMLLSLPRQLKKRHEAAYNASLFSGHSFSGIVAIDESGIEKRTSDEITRITYAECVAWIETTDMLIFCAAQGKSLVIPARCLSKEDAALTCEAARRGVAAGRYYRLAPLVPLAETRLPLPSLEPQPWLEPLLSMNIVYTSRELQGSMADATIKQFFAMFPQKCLTAVLLTIVAYFLAAMPPLPFFLLALLVLFIGSLAATYWRTNRSIKVSEGEVCRLRAELTERYVSVEGQRATGMRFRVPWELLTRVVEHKTDVKFFTDGSLLLFVPKRCIPDMEQFRQLVDTHFTA